MKEHEALMGNYKRALVAWNVRNHRSNHSVSQSNSTKFEYLLQWKLLSPYNFYVVTLRIVKTVQTCSEYPWNSPFLLPW
jgi:hypothetical protein